MNVKKREHIAIVQFLENLSEQRSDPLVRQRRANRKLIELTGKQPERALAYLNKLAPGAEARCELLGSLRERANSALLARANAQFQ